MEAWRQIPSEPKYEASSSGLIRHIKRQNPRAQKIGIWGYPVVNIRQPNGTTKTRRVHRLVCEAFHGAPSFPAAQVAHNNGVRTDCRAENLRWATASENSADRSAHGNWKPAAGAAHPQAKLSAHDVIRICKMAKTNSQRAVAAAMGISQGQVSRIVRGERWKGAAKQEQEQ